LLANARIETNAVDDLACIEPIGQRIAVHLVEIGDAHGQESIGEKLYCLASAAPVKSTCIPSGFCGFGARQTGYSPREMPLPSEKRAPPLSGMMRCAPKTEIGQFARSSKASSEKDQLALSIVHSSQQSCGAKRMRVA